MLIQHRRLSRLFRRPWPPNFGFGFGCCCPAPSYYYYYSRGSSNPKITTICCSGGIPSNLVVTITNFAGIGSPCTCASGQSFPLIYDPTATTATHWRWFATISPSVCGYTGFEMVCNNVGGVGRITFNYTGTGAFCNFAGDSISPIHCNPFTVTTSPYHDSGDGRCCGGTSLQASAISFTVTE